MASTDRVGDALIAQRSDIFRMCDGAIALDNRQEVSYFSEGASELFNTSKFDVIGNTISGIWPENKNFTFVQHQTIMQNKRQSWIEDLVRGQLPEGQTMKGRTPIDFTSPHQAYPAFQAKVAFHPVFVGYTPKEIHQSLETKYPDYNNKGWADKVKLYSDFLVEQDILHVGVFFYRVDMRDIDQINEDLQKEKQNTIDQSVDEMKGPIAPFLKPFEFLVKKGSENWRTVAVTGMLGVLSGVYLLVTNLEPSTIQHFDLDNPSNSNSPTLDSGE